MVEFLEEKMENTLQKKENIFKRLWNYFTTYEIAYFEIIVAAALILAILLPEEDANGVSGIWITILYLLDVIIAMLCELLTSKQSRWSFFIYNFVELIEIATMIILRARFASMAVAIFFWIPAHTAGFINWSKHKDEKDKNVTVVRSMNWWQNLLMWVGIAAWTVGIGYVMAAFSPETDFFSDDTTLKAVAYMDACLSAISIADGITVFFRVKETWLVWYIYLAIETAVNIITGQWILLVLKFGYLTNTTYGYTKWTKYIKDRRERGVMDQSTLF